MPYTPLSHVSTGELATAALHNTLLDNVAEIRVGGIAIPSQTAKDFVYADTSTTFGRLAAVAKKFPRFNAAGTAWEMVYPGVGIKDLWIPITAFRPKPSGGCNPAEDILLSSGRYVTACGFPDGSTTGASFGFPFPKSWNRSTLTFQPYWLVTSGTGAVVWSHSLVAAGDNETLDVAIGTPQTSTDTALSAKNLAIGPESAATTVSGSPQVNDWCRWDLERTPGAAGDTLNATAYLIGIKVRLTTDAPDDE